MFTACIRTSGRKMSAIVAGETKFTRYDNGRKRVCCKEAIELNKKRRSQTAEIEGLKTKCKHLEAALAVKEDELERQRIELRRIHKSETCKNSSDS